MLLYNYAAGRAGLLTTNETMKQIPYLRNKSIMQMILCMFNCEKSF